MLFYIFAICWCQISTYILDDFQFLQINSITRKIQTIITILSLIFLGTVPGNAGQILKHLLLEIGVVAPVQNELSVWKKRRRQIT